MDFIPSFKVSTVLQDDFYGMWKREGFKAINRNSDELWWQHQGKYKGPHTFIEWKANKNIQMLKCI